MDRETKLDIELMSREIARNIAEKWGAIDRYTTLKRSITDVVTKVVEENFVASSKNKWTESGTDWTARSAAEGDQLDEVALQAAFDGWWGNASPDRKLELILMHYDADNLKKSHFDSIKGNREMDLRGKSNGIDDEILELYKAEQTSTSNPNPPNTQTQKSAPPPASGTPAVPAPGAPFSGAI